MAGIGNFKYTTTAMTPQQAQVHAAAVAAHGDAKAAQANAAGMQGAAARSAEGDWLAAEQNARGAVGAAQAGAVGTAAAGYYGGLGNAYAGMYGGMGQAEAGRFGALAGLAGAMSNDNANRYGAYAAAEGNRQNAMANEASSRYSSAAMAEAARQTALGNLGSASIGAYGSTANQALQAWAQNQQAYNQALAQMQGAGQSAMSSYGQSRNAALGNLAAAYGGAGGSLGGASAAGDVASSLGSAPNSFTASNPYGTVASGAYGAAPAVNNTGSLVPGIANQTFAGLGGVGQNLMAQDVTGSLNQQYDRSMNDLNAQHYSSREMPAQMQRMTFADLLTMGDQYIAPTMAGMDQYYANANAGRPDFSAGMDQFYGNMAQVRPDYSGVLTPLTQQSQFDKPSLGRAPTLGGMFGSDAMGAGAMSQLGPVAELFSPAGRARQNAKAEQINAQARADASQRRRAALEQSRINRDNEARDAARAAMQPFDRQLALGKALGDGMRWSTNIPYDKRVADAFARYQQDNSRMRSLLSGLGFT